MTFAFCDWRSRKKLAKRKQNKKKKPHTKKNHLNFGRFGVFEWVACASSYRKWFFFMFCTCGLLQFLHRIIQSQALKKKCLQQFQQWLLLSSCIVRANWLEVLRFCLNILFQTPNYVQQNIVAKTPNAREKRKIKNPPCKSVHTLGVVQSMHLSMRSLRRHEQYTSSKKMPRYNENGERQREKRAL